jgi:hypothetical protein
MVMRTITIHLYAREYPRSILALREELNGSRTGEDLILDIRLPTGNAIAVRMQRKSLYIIAVRDTRNQWVYLRDHRPPGQPVAAFSFGGTHTDLGTTGKMVHSFDISILIHVEALGTLTGHVGQTIGPDVKVQMAMSFLVVSCAEAARFDRIRLVVERLLRGELNRYKPGAADGDYDNLMKDWKKLCTAHPNMPGDIGVRYLA